MLKLLRFASACLVLVSTMAFSQTVTTLADLDSQNRVTLTKDELGNLMPNASMSRVIANGNKHNWKNDPDGTFIIRSDTKAQISSGATAYGKWHISEDGRYCVLIEWKRIEAEEWCRYIVKAGDSYYATKSTKTGAEKVYKLEISK
ncbi:MAG: hypothetical protein ACREBN_12970 [Burkholderiaceae bacterium]